MSKTEVLKKGTKFDSPEQELYLNLWRTYDRLRKLEDELFDQYSLSSQQYNVLRLLKGAYPDAIPTTMLAHRLISRAPDMTRMLDKLEQHGFLERIRPAENRRQVLIKITADGIQLLKSIAKPLQDCHEAQLGHLNPAQIQQLCKLLKLARAPHEEPGSIWE